MSLECSFKSETLTEGVVHNENSCVGNRACYGEVCVLPIDYGFDGK